MARFIKWNRDIAKLEQPMKKGQYNTIDNPLAHSAADRRARPPSMITEDDHSPLTHHPHHPRHSRS
eukprot:scaffold170216_cov41-Cyclotella_meneghiniana.AAC.2